MNGSEKVAEELSVPDWLNMTVLTHQWVMALSILALQLKLKQRPVCTLQICKLALGVLEVHSEETSPSFLCFCQLAVLLLFLLICSFLVCLLSPVLSL